MNKTKTFSTLLLLLLLSSSGLAQVISRFSWNSNPVTTADVGPNATSVSGSAISSAGGVGGTNGLNAGLPTTDINLTIPTGSSIFDVGGIEVSFDFQRDENTGNFFTRGSSLIIMGTTNLSVTYRVDNGAGGFNTVNSGNVFAIPNDNTFRNYSFYYLPTTGIGVLAVNGSTVWTNDGPDNRNMYWTGSGNIVIGSGLDGAGGNQTFMDNLVIGAVTSTPLPIEFLDFSVRLQDNNSALLNWQTATEYNNNYFTVERSQNALDWEKRGEVQGAGNSLFLLNYQFTDEDIHSTTYYRIKQTDFDGQFAYSPIRLLNLNKSAQSEIIIYPNPTKNLVTIEGNYINEEQLKIYNIVGEDVSGNLEYTLLDENKITLDLSYFEDGVYYIQNTTHKFKVIKK